MYTAYDGMSDHIRATFPLCYTGIVTQPLPDINEAGAHQANYGGTTRDTIVANMRARHGSWMSVAGFGLSAADRIIGPPVDGPPGWDLVKQYSPTGPAGFEYQTACWPDGTLMGDPDSATAFRKTCDFGIEAGAQYLICYTPDVNAAQTNAGMADALAYAHGATLGRTY